VSALAGPFAAGLLFAIGLGISGMTHPERIIAFLDVAGAWDPRLLVVMLGALLVHAPLARGLRHRAPLFGAGFALPSRHDIDGRLLAGAALFGIGWGLGGFCPGPAIVALLSGSPAVFVFVLSMLAGMAAFELRGPLQARRGDTSRRWIAVPREGSDG
jgi:hypothetical protein